MATNQAPSTAFEPMSKEHNPTPKQEKRRSSSLPALLVPTPLKKHASGIVQRGEAKKKQKLEKKAEKATNSDVLLTRLKSVKQLLKTKKKEEPKKGQKDEV